METVFLYICLCVCVLSAFPLVKSTHFLTFFSFHSLQHIILHFSVSTVLYCTIHIHNIPPPTPINWSEATVTTTVQKSHSLEFSLVFHWICPVTLPLCRRTSILTRNCRTQEISWCLCVYIHIVLWRWRWWWWWRFVYGSARLFQYPFAHFIYKNENAIIHKAFGWAIVFALFRGVFNSTSFASFQLAMDRPCIRHYVYEHNNSVLIAIIMMEIIRFQLKL